MKFNIRNIKNHTEYTNLTSQQANKIIQEFYQGQESGETRYANIIRIEDEIVYITLTTDWGF